jgi:protein TonB
MWSGAVSVGAEAQQRKLIHSVPPVYPDLARQAGIEGTVRLKAIIGKDGAPQDLKVLSGESVLADAAFEAVRQWRYQPTRWMASR